jgi:GNAT superfamily N-acetyltransferase
VEDHPAADDLAALDDRVEAYTLGITGNDRPCPLAVFARDDEVVVGGVHGWTWGGCCELVTLWVSEPRRGQGLGRSLLARAEEAAASRGCGQVVVFTHDVQAPSLFLHAGYELVGEVDGYPAGGAAYWFRKRLDRRAPGVSRWGRWGQGQPARSARAPRAPLAAGRRAPGRR